MGFVPSPQREDKGLGVGGGPTGTCAPSTCQTNMADGNVKPVRRERAAPGEEQGQKIESVLLQQIEPASSRVFIGTGGGAEIYLCRSKRRSDPPLTIGERLLLPPATHPSPAGGGRGGRGGGRRGSPVSRLLLQHLYLQRPPPPPPPPPH
ncbi:unnamed protein product [Pleuronectes platessa]|uniref:Uncharacterized protein n=1 Tax=Pleuronectes platessa TaxID=8262 RepID=A0A9N7ZDJ0_PLEPL|nr:unnamed protein product [Pleuronectes platessa]